MAVGDSLQVISGDAGGVTGLNREKLDKPIPVYNLDVEDFHSYFVGSGVLVHNKCLNNAKANRVGRHFGYKDAEDFKKAFVGSMGKRYNINKCG